MAVVMTIFPEAKLVAIRRMLASVQHWKSAV